jgi:long-chain-fatty-acid--CoA ligase ACSBG
MMNVIVQSQVGKETGEPTDKLSSATLEWLRQSGCKSTYSTVSDVIAGLSAGGEGEVLRKAIQSGIDRANRNAPSRAQTIQKWTILPRDFTVSGGELGKFIATSPFL